MRCSDDTGRFNNTNLSFPDAHSAVASDTKREDEEEEDIYEDMECSIYDYAAISVDRRSPLLCFPKKTEKEIAAELLELEETEYECCR